MKRYIFLLTSFLIFVLLVAKDTIVQKRAELAARETQRLIQAEKPSRTNGRSDNIPIQSPIGQLEGRVAKKPFGVFVEPKTSPVQPEKFSGFHTGTDFETFPEEQNLDIPIYAITNGKIILKKTATGYGGLLVQSAIINNSPVTVVYGHLKLASINKKVGDSLEAGEKVGILGMGYGSETDGERKHLHLGIHKGEDPNIVGYVQNKNQLNDWIDPMSIL